MLVVDTEGMPLVSMTKWVDLLYDAGVYDENNKESW